MNNKIMQGEIVYKRRNEYLVDIKTGVDVTLLSSECLVEHNIGDSVNVIITGNIKGETYVSEKLANKYVHQSEFDELMNANEKVTGKIIEFKNAQFIVDLGKEIEGVCFIRNLERHYIKDGSEYVGKTYDFNIVGYAKGRERRYELTRTLILEKEFAKKEADFKETFEIDNTYIGTVVKHLESGILISIDQYECFVPKSEISYVQKELPAIGSDVTVKIIRLNSERFNVVGSIKLTHPDPWENTSSLESNKIYSGPIVRIENYGIFVELFEDIHGLVHISELSHDFLDNTDDYKIGDIIEFKIIEINEKSHKIKLSVKALTPSKYDIAKEKFKVGDHLTLPITKFYRTGIFVQLMDNYNVFVRNSEINNFSQVRPMLQYNSKLDFILIEFNDEKEEIVLSNQAYVENEQQVFEEAMKI